VVAVAECKTHSFWHTSRTVACGRPKRREIRACVRARFIERVRTPEENAQDSPKRAIRWREPARKLEPQAQTRRHADAGNARSKSPFDPALLTTTLGLKPLLRFFVAYRFNAGSGSHSNATLYGFSWNNAIYYSSCAAVGFNPYPAMRGPAICSTIRFPASIHIGNSCKYPG
jgi:hypothetical protein